MRLIRLVAFVAALGIAAPALAQGQRGRLLVTVADTTAAVIPPGIGPIRGGFNASIRAGGLSARNPFAPERGPDHNQRFGMNVGGALKQNKSSFSVNFNHSIQYTAPTLNVVAPGA